MTVRIETLENRILGWAHDRGIMTASTPEDQWGKTYEEMGELYQALRADDQTAITDAIGDVLVTLIIQAHMQGLDLTTCLHVAWNAIKDRHGRMVDGLFVKEDV